MDLSRRSFAKWLPLAGLASAVTPAVRAQSAGVFQHGVASGDPLLNQVILWTRVAPGSEPMVPVEWVISEDPSLSRVYQRGLTYTNSAFDFTVKVDVTRLAPSTTYYYQFLARGSASPVGRTRTLPAGAVDRVRLAIASCSNYPFGYFNAYRSIARRQDLDAVLHLGDYIYEYGNRQFGDGQSLNRIPSPDKEIVTLADYRQRYAQYRSDPDLQEAHRQHPWIIVWDDHESTNNAWNGGAQNHQPDTEGDWAVRKYNAHQAWLEWQPVRENPYLGGEIYRSFRIGNLIDLVMLDTRLAGRDEEVAANSPQLLNPSRTLLGADQEAWFLRELSSSAERATRWRLIGQQIMMGQLLNADGTPFNPDQWDGYPVTRNRFLQHLAANSIRNVVVLAGDIHSSWANEISGNPFVPNAARQAVEFVTPGITSPAIPDRAQATSLEQQIGASHPHVKHVDLFRRGYMLLDVDRDRAQAEWYHPRTLAERSPDEERGSVFFTAQGESRLQAGTPSAARSNGAPLAP